MFILPALA